MGGVIQEGEERGSHVTDDGGMEEGKAGEWRGEEWGGGRGGCWGVGGMSGFAGGFAGEFAGVQE